MDVAGVTAGAIKDKNKNSPRKDAKNAKNFRFSLVTTLRSLRLCEGLKKYEFSKDFAWGLRPQLIRLKVRRRRWKNGRYGICFAGNLTRLRTGIRGCGVRSLSPLQKRCRDHERNRIACLSYVHRLGEVIPEGTGAIIPKVWSFMISWWMNF